MAIENVRIINPPIAGIVYFHDDDVKVGDWDLTAVIVGMYVDGTCIDDIDAVDVSLDVHISGESNVDVVVKYCFDVFGDVLERSARVESRDSVLAWVLLSFLSYAKILLLKNFVSFNLR